MHVNVHPFSLMLRAEGTVLGRGTTWFRKYMTEYHVKVPQIIKKFKVQVLMRVMKGNGFELVALDLLGQSSEDEPKEKSLVLVNPVHLSEYPVGKIDWFLLEHAVQKENFNVAEVSVSFTLARVVKRQNPMDELELGVLDQESVPAFLLLLIGQGGVGLLSDQSLMGGFHIPILRDVTDGVRGPREPKHLVEHFKR